MLAMAALSYAQSKKKGQGGGDMGSNFPSHSDATGGYATFDNSGWVINPHGSAHDYVEWVLIALLIVAALAVWKKV